MIPVAPKELNPADESDSLINQWREPALRAPDDYKPGPVPHRSQQE